MANLGAVIRYASVTGKRPFHCTDSDFQDLVRAYNTLMNKGQVEIHSRFVHDVFVDYGINVSRLASDWIAHTGSIYFLT